MLMYLQRLPAHQRRILFFLFVAMLLHSIVLIGLWDRELVARPELADWINIKLVAGLDESNNKATPQPQRQTHKPAPPPENKPDEQAQADEATDTKARRESESEAQYFVKADSRPFERQNPKPYYPAAARKRGMQGLVLLRVEVNIRGKVSHIELKKSSGYRLLDEAALATVRRWRFMPAKRGEQAVTSVVEIPVRFELRQGS